MLKTISAVLLAASVVAAPALAASGSKTDAAAVNRTASVKSGLPDANAKMHKHHVKQARHHVHHKKMAYRHHKKIGSIKSAAKAGQKPSAFSTKRG